MKKIGKNTKLYLIGMIIGGITLGITTVIADTVINSTSVSYKTTTVKAALDELYDIADFKQEVKDMLYPVGSIYISVSSTNPSELFGGEWVSFGKGRTLFGVDPNNNSFNLVEKIGGSIESSINIYNLPGSTNVTAGNVSGHAITVNGFDTFEQGHTLPNGSWMSGPLSDMIHAQSTGWYPSSVNGYGKGLNVLNPYITVYMWKRTT